MLIDEVTAMSKSQQARANVLERLRIELWHLNFMDQTKVTEELISDLTMCLQQARSKKVESLPRPSSSAKLLPPFVPKKQ
jgi:hypothetical protein